MEQMMMTMAAGERVAEATRAAGPASSQLRPPQSSSHTHSYAAADKCIHFYKFSPKNIFFHNMLSKKRWSNCRTMCSTPPPPSGSIPPTRKTVQKSCFSSDIRFFQYKFPTLFFNTIQILELEVQKYCAISNFYVVSKKPSRLSQQATSELLKRFPSTKGTLWAF